MRNIAASVLLYLAIASSSFAQPSGPGPGPTPNPWIVNGATISYSNGGVIVGPQSTTGGSKGVGTINVSGGYYVNGAIVGPVTGGTNGTLLQGVTSSAPVWTATPTLGVAGSVLGKLSFANLTSGSITIQPQTGALGSSVLTAPAFTDTLVVLAGSQAITGKTYNGLTITTTTGTLTVTNGKILSVGNTLTLAGTDGKTLTVSNSITLAGTDSTVMTFPTTSATIARTDAGQTFTGTNIFGVLQATSLALGGCTVGANALCATGSAAISSTLTSAAHVITSASASALAVGLNGSTNPALQIDTSTASSATGLKIKSAAAAGGLAVSVITSGSNENLTIDAAGNGTITLGGTSTGAIIHTRATTLSAALTYGGVTLTNAVTGTGSMVLSSGSTIAGLTVTSSFTATGLVTNAALANPSVTVNTQTCTLGSSCTITATAASMTVGTTTIASGTDTRILRNNAGVLGEYTISGSGTVVAMQTGASLVTPAIGVATGTSLALNGCTIGTNAFCATGTANISSAITIGGAITYGGVTLSNAVVGTGAMVLATAPTFASTVNAVTGYQVNGGATSGNYLRGNGTNFVSAAIAAGDLPLATNAAIGGMRGDTTTISCTAGVCSAVGAAATDILVGTTTVTSGTTLYLLYNNGGVLGNRTIASVLTSGTGITVSGTTNATISLSSARQTLPTIQTFTSGSGTYTTPANVLWISMRLVGGGGGGSATNGGNAGSNGGHTCWNTSGAACTSPVYQAGGGIGATGGGTGGTGGTVSGSGTCSNAQSGSVGGGAVLLTTASPSGIGGSNPLGQGGAFVGSDGTSGLAAGGRGGGGGGAGFVTAVGFPGGGGGGGAYCEVIITSPAATYTYAVGALGAGGTASGSFVAGGAGTAGWIQVIEHYGS